MLETIISNVFPLTVNHTLVFGLFMILGVMGGLFSGKFTWIPTISSLLLIGLIMGPEGIGIIDKKMLGQAADIVHISLGLILYKLGSSLHLDDIVRQPKILLVSLIESTVTFLAVYLALSAFGFQGIVCVLAAAISISSSPAVLIHVAKEMHADGVVTDNAKTLVALNNLISFFVFTAALPFALHYSSATWVDVLGIPFYRSFIALFIGTVIAFIVGYLARLLNNETAHYSFPLLIGGIMLTLGLSLALQGSFLFACLVFGIILRWQEKQTPKITSTDFGYGEDFFYIVLFVTAGASLHLQEIYMAGWVALAFPFIRCLAKFLSLFGTTHLVKYNYKQSISTGLLLFPMAGMAIGLLQTTNLFIPKDISEQAGILIFAAVAVLETVGPPIAKWAFILSGETKRSGIPRLDDQNASLSDGDADVNLDDKSLG